MSHKKFRAPWPELILVVIGAVLIAIGKSLSIGIIGAIGIPIVAASLIAVILAVPLSLISSRGQILILMLGVILAVFGIWYVLNMSQETEIFSPALLGFVGAAMGISSIFTLLLNPSPGDPRKQN